MPTPDRPLTSCEWWRNRTLATILVGALATSATAPAGVAFAQEARQGQEGTAPPDAQGPDATSPDFDPGADSGVVIDIEGAPDDAGDDTAPPADQPIEEAEVDRLYALNRDRVGPDPNAINEGALLRLH